MRILTVTYWWVHLLTNGRDVCAPKTFSNISSIYNKKYIVVKSLIHAPEENNVSTHRKRMLPVSKKHQENVKYKYYQLSIFAFKVAPIRCNTKMLEVKLFLSIFPYVLNFEKSHIGPNLVNTMVNVLYFLRLSIKLSL